MNGRGALKALADGHKVRRVDWAPGIHISADLPEEWLFHSEDLYTKWEILETPATDKELIAEMRKRAADPDHTGGYREGMKQAARLLETRKLKP